METPAPTDAVGWWTIQDAQNAWPDQSAPDDVVDLARYLQVAYEQCTSYAAGGDTDWVEPDPVPESFRQAQLVQCVAVWTFERAGGGDAIGPDGYAVRVYPMGWQVKNLLRPDTGVPVIG